MTKLISLLAAVLLCAGCTTTQHVLTGAARPAIAVDQVRVVAEAPPGAVQIALLHITAGGTGQAWTDDAVLKARQPAAAPGAKDRESRRLDSSHRQTSRAAFCL